MKDTKRWQLVIVGGEMPTPSKNESQKDFISRCIPIVIGEGVKKDQAAARCYSIWRRSKGIKDEPPKEKKSATNYRVARAGA